jgi:PGF-CTERM protein
MFVEQFATFFIPGSCHIRMSAGGSNSVTISRQRARQVVALGLVLLSVTVAGAALGGVTAQSQSSPIEVSDWTDLDDIRDDLDGDYVLVNDLDETTPGYETVAGPNANDGKGFDPIGGFENRFSGSFDGNGHTISDLQINRTDEGADGVLDVGLFGGSSGEISDVTLANADMTSSSRVGGLVSYNSGTVSNSSASGNVTGPTAGGLVGQNAGGTVSNSSASAAVTGSVTVGGLVGENGFGVNAIGGAVINSSASGNVTGSDPGGDTSVGGLVGNNFEGTVINSSASGNVTGFDFEHAGGLVGSGAFGSTVINSSASGNVTGSENVGGLVGGHGGTVSNSSASGNVTGSENVGGLVGGGGTVSTSSASGNVTGDTNVGGLVGANFDSGMVSTSSASGAVTGSNSVGGLVGVNLGPVSNSSASGNVTGSEDVGGLVGNHSLSTVSESFATGAVTGSSDVGGLVGQLGFFRFISPGAILRDSYYDTQTTEQQAAVGAITEGNGTAEARGEVTGFDTTEMQGASAAQNLEALDFTSTWQTVTDPAGYPELQALDIGDTDSDGGDGENGDTNDDGSDAGDDGGSDDGGSDDDGDGGNSDGGNGGDGFGPGFGPGVVLAGLSGAGYLLKRRGTTNDTDAE